MKEPKLFCWATAVMAFGALLAAISIRLIEGYFAPGYTRYCYDDPEYGDTCDNVINDWSWITTPAAIIIGGLGVYLFLLWKDEQ